MPSRLAQLYRDVHQGVNYRLRTFAGGRWARHCRPTSIALLVTERCNARCIHCDIWKNKGKEDSPTLEQWETVLGDLRRWLGPVQVTISGGEALLKPFTPELVRHGTSLGLFMEVLTHGYWPEQTRIEKLAHARPWRVTISLDAVGPTHSRVRGRPTFYEHTATTLRALQRLRCEGRGPFEIRLKTVIMSHNLDEVCEVARFARGEGVEVFYQPIEQNYNTTEDARWFEQSANWPADPARAVAVVQQLIGLKEACFPIANSRAQLEAMIPYFLDPDSLRLATQNHSAHERRPACAALTTLQFQANGDVTVCTGLPPIGSITRAPIRELWETRPPVWEEGCCLARRASPAEQHARLAAAGLGRPR